MDQSPKRNILVIAGTFIGYLNVATYMVFTFIVGRAAIRDSKCIFPFSIYVCIGIWVCLVLMVAASSEVGRGIKSKSAILLAPYLVLDVLFAIGAIVLLFYIREMQLVVVSVVLGISVLSWYPIFCLYQRLKSSNDGADHEMPSLGPSENCPLNPSELGANAVVLLNSTHHNAANFAATAPDYVEASGSGSGKPPSYDSLTNVPGSNPLQAQGDTVIGSDMDWPIKVASKETDI